MPAASPPSAVAPPPPPSPSPAPPRADFLAAPPRSPRWRLFADILAAVLGLNVWITLILVPGLYVAAYRSPPAAALAALPLVPLGIGLYRRSPLFQLGLYPAALLLPIAYAPRVVAGNVHGPWSFILVAASLVGYLFSVSFFSSFHDAPAPSRTRALRGAEPASASRWRRRFRIYRALTLFSAAIPAAMLYSVDFDKSHLASLREKYPGRVGSISALLNLGVLALWLLIFSWAFVGVLKRHRTGDPQLFTELERLRRGARRGVPRPIFYLWVTLALGLMGVLVVLRYR